MAHWTVSWTRIARAGQDSRPAIPAGLLGARAQVQMVAKSRRRALVTTSGAFDRAAIMSAAAVAATGLQERLGISQREALSTALKAAWQAAKMARAASAH